VVGHHDDLEPVAELEGADAGGKGVRLRGVQTGHEHHEGGREDEDVAFAGQGHELTNPEHEAWRLIPTSPQGRWERLGGVRTPPRMSVFEGMKSNDIQLMLRRSRLSAVL
jgi:hypothetical protein